jgi:hypothetical protein
MRDRIVVFLHSIVTLLPPCPARRCPFGHVRIGAVETPTIHIGSITVPSTEPQFAATGTYSDGSIKTITTSVDWSSSIATVATINSRGLATGAGTGSSVITATLGSVTGSTTLRVQPALVSVTVIPANASLKVGSTLQFKAIGTYSDNSTQDLTSSAEWSVSNASVATATRVWQRESEAPPLRQRSVASTLPRL